MTMVSRIGGFIAWWTERLFPRPRRVVTWRDSLSLVVFLSLYIGVLLYLVLSKRLVFARPGLFGLMVVTPWMWWMAVAGYAGLSKVRTHVSLIVRLALAGTFAMVLAEPRSVRTQDVLSVVFTVDVSDSVDSSSTAADDSSSNKALKLVAQLVTEKPEKDQAGLVVFGRNAAVEQPPRQSFPLDSGRDYKQISVNSQIDKDATNLEQALSLSAAMIPSDTAGRIVLFTDAAATEGNLQQVLGDLKSRDIPVDVLPIRYEYDKEVWVERLDVPRFIKLGEPYRATAVVSSLTAGKGTLILRQNGKEVEKRQVEYPDGKSRHDFEISVTEAGYFEYTVSIDTAATDDRIKENNTAMNYLLVEGEGKVLIVSDPAADPRDYESLVKALREGERVVQVIHASELPRDALSMMPYDAVAFVNVGVESFDPLQLQAVHDAVQDLGIGFAMIGGPNSFGPGGYHRTVVEEALPVTMDITQKKVLPKGALAIILHTCEFPEGNTWAKRITKQAIKVLGAQDEVGVLAYTEFGEDWIFELTPASEYEKMVPKINGASIGDMPSFQATMQLGLNGLKKNDAATKHMIIISDGDPSPATPALMKQFIDNKISISTIAIFPHGGNDISLLRAMADQTGGRYYFPADPNELPSIFIKESKTLKRNMIQQKTITPELGLTSRNVLNDINSVPQLHGYVLTTAKERLTERVLTVTEEDQIDPILATWSYGLGRTAAFTSDLSPNWGRDWVSWTKYRAFVNQLFTDISRVRKQGHLRMWAQTNGTQAEIFVEDYAPEESLLEIATMVSGPREKSETVTLKQVGPRRYQGTVPLWGRGRYQVVGRTVGGDRKETVSDGLIVSYSPEYLRFRSNPQIYRDIIEKTGGQELTGKVTAKDIFEKARHPKTSSRPIFDWFLIALACLIPLDVAIRRVQLDWAAVRGWFGLDKKSTTTATMSALLQRKQAVGSALKQARQEKPLQIKPGSTPPPARPGASSSPRPPAPPPPKPAIPEGTDTTSRLLANKRKRQEGDKP